MKWLRPEDHAEISPTYFATYVENTLLLLIGSLSQVSQRVLTMFILVLNLTRIKLRRHTWCACLHRDSVWVGQWQEKSELWNSHGLEGADKPCH